MVVRRPDDVVIMSVTGGEAYELSAVASIWRFEVPREHPRDVSSGSGVVAKGESQDG